MGRVRFLVVCVLFQGILGIQVTLSLGASKEEYQQIVIDHLEAGPASYLHLNVHGRKAAEIDTLLLDIYTSNNFLPFWLENDKPGKRAKAIVAVLDDALSHGLDPESYFVDLIHQHWEKTDVVGQVRLDILLTLGMMRYVADQREGRTEPHEVDPKLFASARNVEVNWRALWEMAFTAPDMMVFLEQQAPPFQQYSLLMNKLAEYRILSALGGWPTVAPGETLKPGMKDQRILEIRKRLAATGELAQEKLDGEQYDAAVEAAVKRFQKHHGLQPDGFVGNNTLEAMNVPVETRIRQIALNMERYRWLERKVMDEPMVVVNIAGFVAAAGEPGKFDLTMPIIVGSEYHQTPVFSDTIKYVEFNPYWTLPSSIARNEVLPKLQRDPHYLKKQKMRLFKGWDEGSPELDSVAINWKKMTAKSMNTYRIRQDPGPWNALGTLKIMFPNSHDVYLHDTPGHDLFQKDTRSLSHGCIRMSQPADMAAWVLGGERAGWSVEKIKEIVATGKRKVVVLDQPIPVYILYRTAIVDINDNTISFYRDVYDRDRLLGKALSGSLM